MKDRFGIERNRRILFNWDGSDIMHLLGEDPTPEAYEQYSFSALENSQVDTMLFNFGSGNVAEYASKVLPWPGEAYNFEFDSDDSRLRYENPKKLAEMGANPPLVISNGCRKRGMEAFVSMRMNDTHDGFMPSERAQFKIDHPEWLVPELRDHCCYQQDAPGFMVTSLNYAVKEVRELKLAVIREYFEQADWDGIELDWSRHNNHFPPGTEFANRHYLTEFTKCVREIVDEAARRLGHPVSIFARVPESVAGCYAGGYDIAEWFRQDIVDGLCLGDMVVSVPYMQEFRDLMCVRPIPLYPSMYGYGVGYDLWDDDLIRGIAAGFWAAGADGISTYNMYPEGNFRRDVLKQMGDPKTLEGLNKRYICPIRMLLGYTRFSRHNYPPADLPTWLNLGPMINSEDAPNATVWANLYVGDDLQGKNAEVELQLRLDCVQPEDRIFISINGHGLTKQWDHLVHPHLERIEWNIEAGSGDSHWRDIRPVSYTGLRFKVPAEWVRKGNNCVQVLMLPSELRNSEQANDLPPVRVARIEMTVTFA